MKRHPRRDPGDGGAILLKILQIMNLNRINQFILRRIKIIEIIGVMMRIFSFSLVSWLGPKSPFLFVWAFNTSDAVILSWCSTLKKDAAYIFLNVFWIMVGIVGMLRASGILR
jgi:hypothetical protein